MTLKHGSFCTGYGGLDMAAQAVFGGDLAWWSDIEPGPIKVMKYRRPDVPNIGDIKTADWSSIEPVDIITAGYPCQPFSNAGKRLGTEDPRHLWPFIAEAISVIRPRIIILENVGAHLRRGFDVVSQDLTALGYDAAWSVVRASDVGAAHRRERLFIVAQDTNQQLGIKRGSAATGEAESGRTRSDAGGRDICTDAVPDAPGIRRGEGRPEPTGEFWGPNASERGSQVDTAGTAVTNTYRSGVRAPEVTQSWGGYSAIVELAGEDFDWQQYGPAIRRWERCLGLEAPYPAVRGPRGGVKVSPHFGEWLMGVPGRITSVPDLTINERLKLVGNGVVPQQAEHAIRGLYSRLIEERD